MIDYEVMPQIFGKTNSYDGDFYQYVVFQDQLFEIAIRMKYITMDNELLFRNNNDLDDTKIKNNLIKRIKNYFPSDQSLMDCTKKDLDFCDFILK